MRPPTLKSAKKRAWKAFSHWICKRDKACVTCGSTKDPQGGHFHHNVLDFDEININRQCSYCNNYLSGRLNIYAEYLLHRYGAREFSLLSQRRYQALKGEKLSIEELLALEKKYLQTPPLI